MTPAMTSLDMSVAPISGQGRRVPILVRVLRRLTDWRDARATRAALRRLSAHELADIGLTPDAVERMTWRR